MEDGKIEKQGVCMAPPFRPSLPLAPPELSFHSTTTAKTVDSFVLTGLSFRKKKLASNSLLRETEREAVEFLHSGLHY